MDYFSALLEFLKAHGSPVVLVWAIIETDLVFLVVGALVHFGYLNPYSCFSAALTGALIHDTAVFWLARNRAEWVRKRKAYQKVAKTLEAFAARTGFWQLSICRPLYGTRYPTIIFWGLQGISYPRFYMAILAGLVPWATMLSSIGYVLFHYLLDFDDWLKSAKNWITGAVILAVLIYVFRSWRRKKNQPQPSVSVQASTSPEKSS